MKSIKKTFFFIVLAAFLWGAVGIVRPFWHRYWLKKDMQVAAIYGTKNRPEDTRALWTQKMKERGLDLTGDDFSVEKDEKNRVYTSRGAWSTNFLLTGGVGSSPCSGTWRTHTPRRSGTLLAPHAASPRPRPGS